MPGRDACEAGGGGCQPVGGGCCLFADGFSAVCCAAGLPAVAGRTEEDASSSGLAGRGADGFARGKVGSVNGNFFCEEGGFACAQDCSFCGMYCSCWGAGSLAGCWGALGGLICGGCIFARNGLFCGWAPAGCRCGGCAMDFVSGAFEGACPGGADGGLLDAAACAGPFAGVWLSGTPMGAPACFGAVSSESICLNASAIFSSFQPTERREELICPSALILARDFFMKETRSVSPM